MKKILLTVIAIVLLNPIKAQDSLWTLEKCINYALENNIQIKQQELNAKINENQLLLSKAVLLPNLNLGASQTHAFGRALDETTYEFTDNESVRSNNLGARTSMTLFNGFQNINTIKQNEFNLMASLQDVERIKNNISLNIASALAEVVGITPSP